MGLFDIIRRLLGGGSPGRGRGRPLPPPGQGHDVAELARRLEMSAEVLQSFQPEYRQFEIPKRTGGRRTITAPQPATKSLQRRILRRLLSRLRAHPAACGFERKHSIASHALGHTGRPVVLHMDLKSFFPTTSARRVHDYFRRIGWNRDAADLLTRLCTHEGGLPQGAPTSPRLSNLVNYRLDARLTALTRWRPPYINPKTLQSTAAAEPADDLQLFACRYSRYADDITFSFASDDHAVIQGVIYFTKWIVEEEGYQLHQRKKLRIMRQHDRQVVTGLVVNQRVQLPRQRRRWLRAVRHRLAAGSQPATLSSAQLAGWEALESMIRKQTTANE